jgi:formylglycine-generating enzyme required for sulfatase activity/tRNA A-37 threonylcarbamoyl transferase component Bud32
LQAGARPLPEYELVQRLGRGGVGEVWKARGPGGYPVALKFLQLDAAAGTVEQRSLDALKNADVRHPQLVAVFGVWQRDDYLVVAMELGDRTLLDCLNEYRRQGQAGIPAAELLEYLREAAKGLDHLNARGIQHRDVKPQNFLLVGGGVKVADFGMAKLLRHSQSGHSGSMTPAYAPPEFFHNEVSRQSDQYSLAVTYCQLRSGRLPFEGHPAALAAGHLFQPPDLSMLPEAERPAVARALDKSPAGRWPSCRAFIDGLAPHLTRAAPEAEAPPLASEPLASTCSEPPPPLELAEIAPLTVTAGQSRSVEVRVQRRHCSGPVRLEVEGLPDQVRSEPVTLAAEAASTCLQVAAAEDAAAAVQTARVLARLGNVQAVREVQVTVLPRPGLRLLPVADVALEPGQGHTLDVQVERQNCPGKITLQFVDLLPGVRARLAAPAPANDNQVPVRLLAADDAAAASRAVRLLARTAAGVRAECSFRLTVRPAVVNSVGMKFVRILPGKFLMGSPEDEKDRGEDEPLHEVEITRPFYLGVYPVTQAEYGRMMKRNPSWFAKDGSGRDKVRGMDTEAFPVENVSWEDAQEFCRALAALPAEGQAGRAYRLPTEAEWEYACRGPAGTNDPFHFGTALSPEQANYGVNLGRPCRVGSYPANAWGLYDLHGNVWEWCQDWYDKDCYRNGPRRDPQGPGEGDRRVLRGGSWNDLGWDCRAAIRSALAPRYRNVNIGFRLVLVPGDGAR